MIQYGWDKKISKYTKRNFRIIQSDYQCSRKKEYLLASGNITIRCASANRRCDFEIINISLATTASVYIKTTGEDTFINNATYIKLASKGDIVAGAGDGRNYQIIDKLRRGVEISW